MKDTLSIDVDTGLSPSIARPVLTQNLPHAELTKSYSRTPDGRIRNILSIDVEDYFHPTEAQGKINLDTWKQYASRVETSMQYLLDDLAEANVYSTCFILGWLAEQKPRLVEQIANAGHEIACHSYAHQLVYELTPKAFKQDTLRAVRAIEDACGVVSRIYRAPSCSITAESMWALEVLAECGFTHDSSVYPISHDRYGVPGGNRRAYKVQTKSGPITEVPVATVSVGGMVSPVGGGAYLRLFPYRYTAAGIRHINATDKMPACLYVHPWEFDPEQPRLISGFVGRMRTYSGLSSMRTKLNRLIRDFEFGPLGEIIPG